MNVMLNRKNTVDIQSYLRLMLIFIVEPSFTIDKRLILCFMENELQLISAKLIKLMKYMLLRKFIEILAKTNH